MLKVGDKVTIRKDLIVGEDYGEIDFVSNMQDYLNKKAIITEVKVDIEGEVFYCLDVDGEQWMWSEEMFENNSDENEAILLINAVINELNTLKNDIQDYESSIDSFKEVIGNLYKEGNELNKEISKLKEENKQLNLQIAKLTTVKIREYKIGDIVKIRDDLEEGKQYGTNAENECDCYQTEYKNHIGMIIDCYGYNTYEVQFGNGETTDSVCFDPEMFVQDFKV